MRTLGETLTAAERLAVIASARALIGRPWGHQGRGPFRWDCVGILDTSFATVRPIPATPTDYGRQPHDLTLRARLCEWLGEPVKREPIPCDVVTWRLVGEENHVGLIVPHPDYGIGLLHCYSRAAGPGGGRVIQHGIDAKERRRILEVWSP